MYFLIMHPVHLFIAYCMHVLIPLSTLQPWSILFLPVFCPVLLNCQCVCDFNNIAKEKKLKTMPSANKTIWPLFFGILKDVYWLSFCHKAKPSVLLITFRCSESFVVHFVINVHGINRYCSTTAHSPTLLVCAWTGFRGAAGDLCFIHPAIHT